MMALTRVFLSTLIFSHVLVGCATRLTSKELQEKSLSFLKISQTTQEEVLLNLGIPSAQFQGERILTYRLILQLNGDLKVVPRETVFSDASLPVSIWRMPQYNLVLVFDERQILKTFNLIDMRL